MKKLSLLLLGATFFSCQLLNAQGSPDYKGGIKVKLDEDGKKYLRVISWAQIQAGIDLNRTVEQSPIDFNLRRARVLMFSQITDKFLILTHFGLNSLNKNNMGPLGKDASAQLFFHDVWAQYNLNKNHTIGAGLHYFNGISRLNNQSTLNIMTLDNNRQSWATIGLSDQFARHLGVFGKGNFGRLQYRVSINDATVNGLDTRDADSTFQGTVYAGARLQDPIKSSKTYSGYFDYNLLDEESNFLPYKIGSYLGSKRILNVGAGFFLHPDGAVKVTPTGNEGQMVSVFAADIFYDAPLGSNGGAITAYATYQKNDYGEDYLFSAYGSGSMIYGHAGYVIPGNKDKIRFQPYASYSINEYDATTDGYNRLGMGLNTYFSGHNSKLTIEYANDNRGGASTNGILIQAMIYL